MQNKWSSDVLQCRADMESFEFLCKCLNRAGCGSTWGWLKQCLLDVFKCCCCGCRCCNTCEDVKEAYRQKGWAFKSPDKIEQCHRDGFVSRLEEQKNEGCRIYGYLEVNRVGHFSRVESMATLKWTGSVTLAMSTVSLLLSPLPHSTFQF